MERRLITRYLRAIGEPCICPVYTALFCTEYTSRCYYVVTFSLYRYHIPVSDLLWVHLTKTYIFAPPLRPWYYKLCMPPHFYDFAWFTFRA